MYVQGDDEDGWKSFMPHLWATLDLVASVGPLEESCVEEPEPRIKGSNKDIDSISLSLLHVFLLKESIERQNRTRARSYTRS